MKQSLRYTTLIGMLLIAGCESSVDPTENNLGVPAGAKEGEYGFYINGRQFDGHIDGSANIQPYVIEGAGAVRLSVSLYYNFPDGAYGNVDLSIPFLAPKPQSFQFSDATSLWNPNPVGYAYCDSDGYIYYRSIPGGTLTITKFDTVQNIVSGYFEFTAYETSPMTDLHKTVGISYGYFNDIPIAEGAYGQGSISALLNGTPFISDTAGIEMVYGESEFDCIALFDNGQGPLLNSYISIQRIPLRTGSYAMDSSTARKDSEPILIFWDWNNEQKNSSTEFGNSSGILTITSCDTVHRRISGTFQFSGLDSLGNTITISNGVIDNVQWEP